MADETQHFAGAAPETTDGPEERVREERKRYTTQLQRRAQAHVTAELGAPVAEADTDRQVTMLIQHVLESTGARRASLMRPVPRGRRWHVTTALSDGCFYYGLVAPETLVLSRAACDRKKSVMLSSDHPNDPVLPDLSELGFRSYLGMPIVVSGSAVAIVEAIDVAESENLESYSSSLEGALTALADRLATESTHDSWRPTDNANGGLTEQSILDLVLRPPVDGDDTMEIAPSEWAILNHLDGERPLANVASSAGLPFPQVSTLAASLLERGLARVGRETRRRV